MVRPQISAPAFNFSMKTSRSETDMIDIMKMLYQSRWSTIMFDLIFFCRQQTFDAISGSFRVSAPLDNSDGGASVFVGTSGDNCRMVQFGIDILVNNGKVSYDGEGRRNFSPNWFSSSVH